MKMEKPDFPAHMANHGVGHPIVILKLLGVAALYALLAKVVLTLFAANGVVSIVWPPSGLALAVLLIGGKRYFPGVFLGALIANAMTGLAWGVAAAIAMGNTLEALLGAWLLTRDGRFDSDIRALGDYLRLVVLGGFVACGVAALNGSTTLLVSGFIASGAYFQNLLNWWMGDALGVVLITPLILAWRRMPDGWLEPKRMAEAMLLFALAFLAGQIIFLGWFIGADVLLKEVAKGYWIFLFVTLLAVRLGTGAVVIALAMAAIQALWGASLGVGFFAGDMAKTGLINFWFFIVTLSVVGMALATYFTERKRMEDVLRESEENLNRAQAVGQIGSWFLDIPANRLEWSAETHRMFGIPQRQAIEMKTFDAAIHPDDRDLVLKAWGEAMAGAPYDVEHRIVVGGQTRWVRERARIERDAKGHPLTGIGTVQDVTERKQAEVALHESENKYRVLVEETSDWVWELNENGVFTFSSPQAREITGYELEEIVGKTPFDFMRPEEAKRVVEFFRATSATQKPFKFFENSTLHKDGHETVVETSGTPYFGADGRFVGYRGINRDITERKRIEAKLSESEERYRALFEQSSEPIWLVDVQTGAFADFNTAAHASLGYTREEFARLPIADLEAEETPQEIALHIEKVLAEGYDVFETTHRTKRGELRHILASVNKVTSGGITYLQSTMRDITERKKVEEKLNATRKELESIIEAQPDIFYVIDTDGDLIKWNSALEKLCGLSPETMMKRPAAEFVCEEDRPTVYNGIREVFEKGSALIDVRFIKGDGTLVPHLCSGAVWKNPGGEVLGFIGVGRDMTERKKLDEELELFRLMVEKSGDPIFMIDDEDGCRMMYVNEAALKHYGATREEILTWRIPDWDPNFSYEMLPQHVEEIKKLRNLTIESLHRLKGGQIVPVEITLNYIFYKGRICHFGYFRNITERKEREAELKRSNIDLEQFSYAVSHDMRQPLRMISSYLQLLERSLDGQLDGEKRDYFNFAIEGAKRIDQMLMALLEYSRIGRKGEPPTWIESRTLLDEALQFLQPAIAEAQAKLNISGDWPRMLVSHDEILRLLQNLIGNAAKFRVAGRMPEITVTGEVAGNEWRLCVADNGAGIIPDQIKRLFQVFQRLQSREAYEGTGIGLALCRKIAEHHKGRIWAESTGEGRGSRFYVVLPVLRGRDDVAVKAKVLR